MGVDIDRFVFFKCHDCDRAFWKKALLPPRDHIVQHNCVGNKIATRVFGVSSRTCKRSHPNATCVEKISQEEYSSQPNCGSWERYLIAGNPQRRVKRKRRSSTHESKPVRRKFKHTKGKSNRPKDMNKAVKKILRQNRLVHRRKKHNWPCKKRTSVWEPGDCDDSWNELKVPQVQDKIFDNHLNSEDLYNEFMIQSSFGLLPIDQNENRIDEVDSATSESSDHETTLPVVPRPDWTLNKKCGIDYLDSAEIRTSAKFYSSDEDILRAPTPPNESQDLPDEKLPMWENNPLTKPWDTPPIGSPSPAALDSFETSSGFPTAHIQKLSGTSAPEILDDFDRHLSTQTSSAEKNCQKKPSTTVSMVDDFKDYPSAEILSVLDECENDPDFEKQSTAPTSSVANNGKAKPSTTSLMFDGLKDVPSAELLSVIDDYEKETEKHLTTPTSSEANSSQKKPSTAPSMVDDFDDVLSVEPLSVLAECEKDGEFERHLKSQTSLMANNCQKKPSTSASTRGNLNDVPSAELLSILADCDKKGDFEKHLTTQTSPAANNYKDKPSRRPSTVDDFRDFPNVELLSVLAECDENADFKKHIMTQILSSASNCQEKTSTPASMIVDLDEVPSKELLSVLAECEKVEDIEKHFTNLTSSVANNCQEKPLNPLSTAHRLKDLPSDELLSVVDEFEKDTDFEKHLTSQTPSSANNCQEKPSTPCSIVDNFKDLPSAELLSVLDKCEKDAEVLSVLDKCVKDSGISDPMVADVFPFKGESDVKPLDLEPRVREEESKEDILTDDEKDILTYIDGLIENTD